ncbi:MAG TPA: adenylosuccinate lyase [Chthoniobacterales bacterium]|nr:adenylosuccinate lyase [Chthoniobacterales bacterium]
MISRYSRPRIQVVWDDSSKFSVWLEIEILACEAMAQLGLIPEADAKAIRARGKFSVPEILEIEKRTNHDVIAFLENVASYIGPEARWVHQGLTSSDILDTGLAVQLVRSSDILLEDVAQLREAIAEKAHQYKRTPMIGRSHGIHAEPITFGLKMALMYDEFGRAEKRLRLARDEIAIGKLSGAVGTHAHLDPQVEAIVCDRLGLKPDPLSTQVVQRDRHAQFSGTLAVVASSIDRWATEFRHLQRTEVLEVEEYFAPGQKGSSAMPHKRNPITSERLSGLARIIRGNAVAALENVALWHERDISHSSVERIILPDSCILMDYMLATLADLVAKLQVYPQNMRENLQVTRGLYFSQTILLELTRRGLDRKTAYEVVQRAAMATWQNRNDFLAEIKKVPEVTSTIAPGELEKLCSLEQHFRYIDQTFHDVGL